MKKYIIADIGDDGDFDEFERMGLGIKTIDTNIRLNVYCLDKEEYIEGDKARKNGDMVEGNLYIQYAHFAQKTNLKLMHKLTGIERTAVSPEIEIVVKVTRILDDYTICGITDFTDEEIPIKFYYIDKNKNTNKKLFKEGDTILISRATLCLDIWGYKKSLRKYCGLE